jgi:hypothetical protein
MTENPDCSSSMSNTNDAHTSYEAMLMVEISEFGEVQSGAKPCYDYGDQEIQ